MLAVILALGAAASWGLSAVLVRRGQRDLSTTAGTLVSLITGLVFVAVLVLVIQFERLTEVTLGVVALFALVGVLNFPIGRYFNYLGMARLGVSRSTPLLASAPLFAVIIAVVFTGEELQFATVAGIALILGGLYVTITAPR